MSGTVRVSDGGIVSMKRRRRGRRRIIGTNKEEIPQVCSVCLLFDEPGNAPDIRFVSG